MDKNSADSEELMPAYLGIPTFMRRPVTRDVSQADVVVMGIPFDSGATSFRNGARFGPRKIREASLLMWGYNRHFDVSPLEHLNVIDFGDIDVDPTNIDTTLGLIATEVDRAISAGATVIALGGDHSITLPILRSYAAKKGPLHWYTSMLTWIPSMVQLNMAPPSGMQPGRGCSIRMPGFKSESVGPALILKKSMRPKNLAPKCWK